MESNLQNLPDILHSLIRFRIVGIICQTLLYGIYLCLIPIAVHAMVTNGLQSRARKWLLAIITFMFALSTVYWILSVVITLIVMDSWNSAIAACYGSDNASFCILGQLGGSFPMSHLLDMLPSTLLVNFIVADGIIVWRAWVLCPDQSKVVLMTPVVMLAINTIVYLMEVVVRAIEFFSEGDTQMLVNLNRFFVITQVTYVTLSVFINFSATSIIALKAWKYRKFLMENGIGVRTPSQAIRILVLLLESGMIYILISVVSLASITIFLHFLPDRICNMLLLIGVQLVGFYPILVVLVVEKNRSLDSTFSSFGTIIDVRGDRHSQAEPMTFTPRRVLVSGGQIDLTMKPSNTDIHISFDSTLEPGDTGMDTESNKV